MSWRRGQGAALDVAPFLLGVGNLSEMMDMKRSGKSKAEEQSGVGAESSGRRKRRGPQRVYKQSLPEIAAALAEKAKEGSYLHARALKELADSDVAKAQSDLRRQRRLSRMFLERLDEAEKRD